MRFAVLGSLEITGAAGPIDLRAPKQRLLLAILISRAGRPVSPDRLVELLWDTPAPDQARKALTWHVMKLRAALGDQARVEWQSNGYRLDVRPEDIDAERFELLHRDGTAAMESGDHARAHDLFNEALRLWRGPAYGELSDTVAVRETAARLDELRMAVGERRFEAAMQLGHHKELITELTELVARHPYRENLRGHLMLALYRSGRQAEALAAYREGRAAMINELGIEPGNRLRRLHQRVLKSDPSLTPEPPTAATAADPIPSTVPAQLPSGITSFTGRQSEIATLLALGEATARSDVVGVHSIDGMAGAGKTTLTVHVAQRLAPRFPDGQLFINLHGFSGDLPPTDPSDALSRMLRGLGVPATHIPSDPDDRAALYRSTLSGRRVLVLLDNAANEEQVRPLLPGSAGCMVMITSRRRLLGLDEAQHMSVEIFDRDEAVDLFKLVAGPDRIAGQPWELICEIVELCGRLPLAVRIAASRLLNRTHWNVWDLWRRLSDESRRLAELGVGDRKLAAAFEMSYRELDSYQQPIFRALGLFPGPDFDLHTAAASMAMPIEETRQALEHLVDVNLLNPIGPQRYGFHDLLRVYARQRAHADDSAAAREAVLGRLFDWFARNSHAAAIAMRPDRQALPVPDGPHAVTPQRFDDPDAGLAWFIAEDHNLSAVIQSADIHGSEPIAWLITDAMRGYFFHRADRLKWLTLAETGLKAALHRRDGIAEAAMRHSLGLSATLQSDYPTAEAHYHRGITLAGETGDERRRIELLLCLAGLNSQTGDHRATARYAREALALTRSNGNLMLSDSLHMMGVAEWEGGALAEAARHLREAVDLNSHRGHDSLDDMLGTLSIVYTELGEHSRAESCAKAALEIADRVGSTHSRASALENLSGVYLAKEHLEQAAACADRALILAREASLDKHKVMASLSLALARFDINPAEATQLMRHCLDTALELGMGFTHIEVLIALSHMRRRHGDLAEAGGCARQAVRAAESGHLRLLEGKALNALAAVQLATGDRRTAAHTAMRALEIHRTTGHQLGQAHAHTIAAESYDDPTHAERHRADARRIRVQVKVPEQTRSVAYRQISR